MKRTTGLRFGAATLCSLALVGSIFPATACAQDSPSNIEQLRIEADALVAKVSETTSTYQEAEATIQDLENQIAQNEARKKELAQQLPAQRERTASSVRTMYKFQQTTSNLLELILSSETFDEFLASLRYLDAIHQHNTREIEALNSMVDELEQTNAMLTAQHDAAIQKREEAKSALQEARDARVELQDHAISIAESEQGNREEAIKVAKEALATAQESAKEATFVTSSGNTATVEVPSEADVSTDPLVNNITDDETTDWAARIDAYLEGSPLEGYGETFAQAAATYGVDPRLSPAISTIESSKGEVCFRDHNAWGWGDSSYDDWETAIDAQVKGLATGYDGTLTLDGAQRYCPPNYEEWYSSVANEMDGI